MSEVITIEQIVLPAVGTVLTGVLLWAGHSVNRLNGTVAQLLERTEWHGDAIKACDVAHQDTRRTLSKHDNRISKLEGVING